MPDTAPAAPPKPDWAKSQRERQGKPPRRWPWLVLLALLVAGGIAAYLMRPQPEAIPPETTETAALQLLPSEVLTLAPQELRRTVRLTGTLAPQRTAQLSAQVNGVIETVPVRVGDRVARGDVLVTLDSETLALDLQQTRSNAEATRAQLALAEAQLERAKSLAERGSASASALDQAESSAAQLRASVAALDDQIKSAELRLANARVTAPIAGEIASRAVDPGQFASTGMALLSVVDLDSVELEGNAPIGSASLLAAGQSAELRVDGIIGATYEGRVTRIAPVAASGTRTLPVYVRLENPGHRMRGGMFATAHVIIETAPESLALPETALREGADGTFVLRLKDGVLEAAPVTTERGWDGRLLRVTNGLAPGDQVIAAPLSTLAPGDAVQVQNVE